MRAVGKGGGAGEIFGLEGTADAVGGGTGEAVAYCDGTYAAVGFGKSDEAGVPGRVSAPNRCARRLLFCLLLPIVRAVAV